MDLYETLGVGKNSSKEEIKKAYRKKAKESHPDTGGSPELFNLVSRAHKILTDDRLRDQYDRMGDIDESSEENRINEGVANRIATLFNALLEKHSDGITKVDIIQEIRNLFISAIPELKKEISINETKKKKYNKIKERIKYKGKGSDILSSVIDMKMREAETAIGLHKEELQICEKAEDLLKEYSFKYDKTPERESPFGAFESYRPLGTIFDQMNQNYSERGFSEGGFFERRNKK